MQKPGGNLFHNKFHILLSQGSNDDIQWSSSESSEYEHPQIDKINNITSKNQNRKRKRKKRALKNISNLDITILNVSSERREVLCATKRNGSRNNNDSSDGQTSPIFMVPNRSKGVNVTSTSPIITSKTTNQRNKDSKTLKSPIIVLKNSSPIYSPKVRKKLFVSDSKRICHVTKAKSWVGVNENIDLQRNDNLSLLKNKSLCANSNDIMKNEKESGTLLDENIDKDSENHKRNEEKKRDSINSLLRSGNLVQNLVKNVKTYFESHFSSESASQSQHSINDSPTPKNSSKTSDDIEIISTITQLPSNQNSSESTKEEILEKQNAKPKKMRYKKDGLAYRLSSILKKYNANISLWQHERFLAANSNFVIPKGEHLIFQIRNIQFKYGCYLLEAKDLENRNFLILINVDYLSDCNVSKDVILKLYEPYKILDFNKDFKLIINVCKFEFVTMKN